MTDNANLRWTRWKQRRESSRVFESIRVQQQLFKEMVEGEWNPHPNPQSVRNQATEERVE